MVAALIDHFRTLAAYNAGANDLLYMACRQLSDDERKADLGAYFGSIHGTLNHILLGDRIWMARFRGDSRSSTGLDTVLYAEFEPLAAARTAEDTAISAFAAALTPEGLEGDIGYKNNQGLEKRDPTVLLIAHMFNHQTHHRGQVHDLLSRLGAKPPPLDMHRIIRP